MKGVDLESQDQAKEKTTVMVLQNLKSFPHSGFLT